MIALPLVRRVDSNVHNLEEASSITDQPAHADSNPVTLDDHRKYSPGEAFRGRFVRERAQACGCAKT